MAAETCDQVTTHNLDLLLDQSYDHNTSSTIECDTMAAHEQKKFINVMNNEPYKFGFCPLTPPESYKHEPVHWNVCPTDLEAHSLVTATGEPNFLAARIPVGSQLNISSWHSHLSDYWDVQLSDLLECRFPLDVDRGSLLTSTDTNHASALQNSQPVQSYIQGELSFQEMLGPFQTKPISLHVSPLMVRDKQESFKTMTIMDLSWPKGASVNASVQKDVYLGTQYVLNYLSIDSITSSLVKLGPAALIYKVDISRAFRQITIDPRDIDLFGLKFQDQYCIDRLVPFGYWNGSQIFQRCTDAVRFAMQQHGFPHLFNFIDDLIYILVYPLTYKVFPVSSQPVTGTRIGNFTKKLVPLLTLVLCLGIHTINRTLSTPYQKLADIVNIYKSWVSNTYCSKRQL